MRKHITICYCDRCGREMKPSLYRDAGFELLGRVFRIFHITFTGVGRCNKELELCSECEKSLEKWFREGDKK